MSNQMITFPLLVDLSAEEQQFLAGGFGCCKKDDDKEDSCGSSNGDCGGATMYVGHKIKVTPYSKCVGGETGGCGCSS
ncbi:hypothetical protein I8751_06875 [Nostocaceae cyanobacterium CENA357]|uniref:Uncharacterized protein n=1 Tax=Atlanticothrix silvestris CENA357 TaxID=1725252 RepID=A0A8J7HGC9_9CYAN|nr:hypothetical protein [Atlanticothrix silvestris]MBH8552096.1 hypothetical protein [Atlanticothrix silvestris CENA357]